MKKMKKMILLAALLFSLAPAYAADLDPTHRVRILETFNHPASQLLLMILQEPFVELGSAPPVWQTLPFGTESERERLYQASVVGAYDMIFTGLEAHAHELERQGLLRKMFPVFSEKLILVGPSEAQASLGRLSLGDAMKKIAEEERIFFSFFHDDWFRNAERAVWKSAGIDAPGDNKNYVETDRDEVSALIQAGDEGAYLLVTEGAFAQYNDFQRGEPALVKLLQTGIERVAYACFVDNAGFRRERTAAADRYAAWLQGEDGRKRIESFELGGIRPFSSSGNR